MKTQAAPQDDQTLTPAALAERWSCSVMTVKRRIRAGALRAHKNGRLVRIPLSAVLKYEEEATI
ncbi:MAG: excisionase family DNA-binding protein [Verrucomicrobiaceae bacterium]